MWRTLRNRHLAATHGSIRSQLTAMSFTALTGVSLLIVGYPLWRSVAVFVVPCVLGLFEYVLTRRIPPDEFDRVHKWMSHVGFVVLTFLIAITNGLQGPLAPMRNKQAPPRQALHQQHIALARRTMRGDHLLTGAGKRTGAVDACACAGVVKNTGRQHQTFASLQ